MLTPKNIYDKNHKTFPFDGIWAEAFGIPSVNGCWIIYGGEKQGKTRVALMLAKYLRSFRHALYISAEEGTSKDFREAMKWAGIPANISSLHFMDYEPFSDLKERLSKHKSPQIIFIDNATIYASEIKGQMFIDLIKTHPNTLFILLAHEDDRKQPYTALAKLAKRLANIIIRVEGLNCIVSGRCPGGNLIIDEAKATLFHGQKIVS